MCTNEISDTTAIYEQIATIRRWKLLPVYTRVLVIIGTIIGGFMTGGLAIMVIKDHFYDWNLLFSVTYLCFLVYFLGFLFICLEKSYAIGWAYLSCFCGMYLSQSLSLTVAVVESNTFECELEIPMEILLPLLAVHCFLLISLIRVRQRWKTIGVSRRK